MTEHPIVTLTIDRVVAGGDGLGRHDGLVVFVPRTLEGEVVRARTQVRGRLARGTLLGVERASAARVAPPCEHYDGDACGGCQLQHAEYATQLTIKAQIVADAFRRIAHRTIDAPTVRPAPSPWRYRRKLTLALRRDALGWYAGLRRHDDPDHVFRLNDCRITQESVMGAWREICAAGASLPAARALRGAVQDTGSGLTLHLEGGAEWSAASDFFAAVPALAELWWTPEGGRRRRLLTRGGDANAGVTTGAPVFAQVNAAVASQLQEHVVRLVVARTPAHVIDAYAGSGGGAASLASRGIRVTAIELDRDAVAQAAAALPIPSRAVAGRVEDALPATLPADVVVLNPPRTGVHARVCETLAAAQPRPGSIVYVSCDPATLARDVARLGAWRITSLQCFDLFPQTAHVETVCELVPEAA